MDGKGNYFVPMAMHACTTMNFCSCDRVVISSVQLQC
jgi:hypothetical protein